MRIAEIAIVGTGNEENLFIQSACHQLELAKENITFGRLAINEQLVLHLYGIAVAPDAQPIAWDLIAKKMLGYIVLFPWQDAEAFERLKPIVDHLTTRYDAPVVVAAHVDNGYPPGPPDLLKDGSVLTAEGRFTFCDVRDPASGSRTLITLVDSIIDKMP
jgi:hypothetical protein